MSGYTEDSHLPTCYHEILKFRQIASSSSLLQIMLIPPSRSSPAYDISIGYWFLHLLSNIHTPDAGINTLNWLWLLAHWAVFILQDVQKIYDYDDDYVCPAHCLLMPYRLDEGFCIFNNSCKNVCVIPLFPLKMPLLCIFQK